METLQEKRQKKNIIKITLNWFKKNETKKQELRDYKNKIIYLETLFAHSYGVNPRADQGLSIGDYDCIRTLDKGTYGSVDLALQSSTGKMFAIKSIKKELVVFQTMKHCLYSEKRILRSINHPFIARLNHHFADEAQLYLAMDYYPGGDLHSLLRKMTFLTEDLARFYGAQIAMALDFLHNIGVVHRDLKLENVLLDGGGYVRLGDFGFAEMLAGGSSRELVGTTDYLAPEMVVSYVCFESSYSYSVDWWSFGVFMYLLTTGEFPYDAANPADMCKVIRAKIKYPKSMSKNLRKLLRGLFIKDPFKRLGCNSRGIKGLRDHPWFTPLNWPALFKKEIRAPYVPCCPEIDTSMKRKFTCQETPINPSPFDFGDF